MRPPPYLDPGLLSPLMRERPVTPFFVRARDYRVIDGDTIMLLAPKSGAGRREEAFRIRMFSINAPEKPKKNGFDLMMAGMGLDRHAGSPGRAATRFLSDYLKGRVLLIEPREDAGRRLDRYGRLLARISASGRASSYFAPEEAISVEHHLLRHGHAVLLDGKPPPDPVTPLLSTLYDQAEILNSFAGA